jgi:hypothetical protein
LQDINIEEYLKNPLTCDCSHSPFQYNPSGHVITGDLNIKRNMEEFSVVIMKRFRWNWFKKTNRRHVTYNTRQSVLRRKRIYASEALQDINIEEYLKNPLTCDCSHSPFQYNPSGHVINGDLNIIIWFIYKHDIVGSLVCRNDNIFVMKRGKTLNSFLFFKYRLRSTIDRIFEFVNPTLY